MTNFVTGDTSPAFTGTCLSGTSPADITGATVVLHIRWNDDTKSTKTASIVSGPAGTWSYAWQTGDLAVVGQAQVEAEVTFSNGKIQTFGPTVFTVQAQIA